LWVVCVGGVCVLFFFFFFFFCDPWKGCVAVCLLLAEFPGLLAVCPLVIALERKPSYRCHC